MKISLAQAAVFFSTLASASFLPSPPSATHESTPQDITTVAGTTGPDHVSIHFRAPCQGCFIGTDDGLELTLEIDSADEECSSSPPRLNGLPLSLVKGKDVANGRVTFKSKASNGLGEKEVHASWESTCLKGQASIVSVRFDDIAGQSHVRDTSGFTTSFTQKGEPTILRLQDRPIEHISSPALCDDWLRPEGPRLEVIPVMSDAAPPSPEFLLQIEYVELERLKIEMGHLHERLRQTEHRILAVLKQDFEACSSVKCLWHTAIDKAPAITKFITTHFSRPKPHDSGCRGDDAQTHCSDKGHDDEAMNIEKLPSLPRPPPRLPEEGHGHHPPSPHEGPGDDHEPHDRPFGRPSENHRPHAPFPFDGPEHHDEHPPRPPFEGPGHEDNHRPHPPFDGPGAGREHPPHPPFDGPGEGQEHRPHPPFGGPGGDDHRGPPPFRVHGPPGSPDGPPPRPGHHGPPHGPPRGGPPDWSFRHHRRHSFEYRLALAVISLSLLVLTASFIFLLIKHKSSWYEDPRRRAERAARKEERRNKKLYRKAACKHKWSTWWRRYRRQRSDDYEEKRQMILEQEGLLEGVMQNEIRSLRNASDLVRDLVRAEEGRARGGGGGANDYHHPYPDGRGGYSAPELDAGVGSSREAPPPSYGMPPPRYEDEIEGEITVVDGFRYTPSNTDDTPDSSVVDCNTRLSLDTGRSTKDARG